MSRSHGRMFSRFNQPEVNSGYEGCEMADSSERPRREFIKKHSNIL